MSEDHNKKLIDYDNNKNNSKDNNHKVNYQGKKTNDLNKKYTPEKKKSNKIPLN
jgi:hypothetical protein